MSTLNEMTMWLSQTKVFITVDQRNYSSNGDLIKTLEVPEFTLHWLNNYRQKINTFILVKQVSPVSYGVIQRINLFSWVYNISKCFAQFEHSCKTDFEIYLGFLKEKFVLACPTLVNNCVLIQDFQLVQIN